MAAPAHNVALTAFYCCALRATDTVSAAPVCGDIYAARFVDELVRSRMAPLVRLRGPAAANVARHRLIDDVLRDEKLHARSAPNPLVRRAIDFRRDPLADHLGALAGSDEVYVVLGGGSMYLSLDVLARLASAVRAFLPRARFVADLMSPAFRRWFSARLGRELRRLGAELAQTDAHPRTAIEGVGYRARGVASIVGRAVQAGSLSLPAWLLDTLLRELRDGYAVYTFEPN